MLEKSVGLQKIEVYGCSVRKMRLFGPKIGLQPAHEPPVKNFQYKQVTICLILTNFWYKITFGHLLRWLVTDFEETHFFQRHPVVAQSSWLRIGHLTLIFNPKPQIICITYLLWTENSGIGPDDKISVFPDIHEVSEARRGWLRMLQNGRQVEFYCNPPDFWPPLQELWAFSSRLFCHFYLRLHFQFTC